MSVKKIVIIVVLILLAMFIYKRWKQNKEEKETFQDLRSTMNQNMSPGQSLKEKAENLKNAGKSMNILGLKLR